MTKKKSDHNLQYNDGFEHEKVNTQDIKFSKTTLADTLIINLRDVNQILKQNNNSNPKSKSQNLNEIQMTKDMLINQLIKSLDVGLSNNTVLLQKLSIEDLRLVLNSPETSPAIQKKIKKILKMKKHLGNV